MSIPAELRGQKYISLATFRKNGTAVRTPIWFAESDGKLVFMTRNDSWKYKRIRNNPHVTVAPCNMRGKITGPDFPGTARVLPPDQWARAKQALHRKYWLARLPIWSKKNEYLEVDRANSHSFSGFKTGHDTSICDPDHNVTQAHPLRSLWSTNLRLLTTTVNISIPINSCCRQLISSYRRRNGYQSRY